jgi:hypothetical protein
MSAPQEMVDVNRFAQTSLVDMGRYNTLSSVSFIFYNNILLRLHLGVLVLLGLWLILWIPHVAKISMNVKR